MRCYKILFITTVLLLGLWIGTADARAAVITVDPQQKEFALGETFIANVHINSEGEVINAVNVTIRYSTDLLEVVGISTGESFLTLWAQEPVYEQTAGLISLTGGIPNGSYVVDGKIISITFKTIGSGGAEIGFDENNCSVHLNDGQGTPTPTTFNPGIFQITEDTLVTLTSPTHPDENKWYQNNIFTVSWSYSASVRYSYVLSDDHDEVPDNKPEFSEGIVTFPDLEDGIYFFILREQSPEQTWKVVGKRRVMIDSRPPLPINSYIYQDKSLLEGQYFLVYSTVDKISGIDHYDITEGNEYFSHVKSPYILQDQTQGKVITITAYDMAGNRTSLTIGGSDLSASPDNPFRFALYILLIGVVIAALAMIFIKIGNKK